MARWLALAVAVMGCGPGFTPAYEGEPECGSARVIHAELGAPCAAPVVVACDCVDRTTLFCVDGVWVFGKDICHTDNGLSATAD